MIHWKRIGCAIALACASFAQASWAGENSALSLLDFEGYGNMAFQSLQTGGNSFAGGAHYTPTYHLSDVVAIKGLLGPQLFKSTSNTGSNPYVVMDYLAAANLNMLSFPLTFNIGGGGGTDLRSSGKTRVAVMWGSEYHFENQKLFGLFDRAVLDAYYYFNSSSLYVIQYGLGINL